MFTLNDDLSIYATRGDVVFFSVTAEDNGQNYKFQPGDLLRVKIYGKKDAANIVLQKDFLVAELTDSVEIFLTEEDTKIGEVISKPVDYWYEVELNPLTNPQTIIGYDEDGAKVFRLFPEGDDLPAYVPDPEDFPVVDEELDISSTRPVENQAITRAILRLQGQVYPVGSIYMSMNDTSPADLFGGTWERLKDKFLLAAGDTYAPGETGGEAKHTLETWEMPVHDHSIYDQNLSNGVTLGVEWGQYVPESSAEKSYGITISGTMKTTESGSGEPHNNMPPYLAVYMWVRVA
jgi:hypothetical protein